MRKIILIIIFFMVPLFILTFCGNSELQKLKSENEQLKSKINELESKINELENEIAKLKETDDYHYKIGVDFKNEGKYVSALVEFGTIIDKYPNSIYLSKAAEQIKNIKNEMKRIEEQRIAEERKKEKQRIAEEKRREEEEKYRPKSQDEAIAEWMSFRNNEDEYKGTITTWRIKVNYISSVSECPIGHLGEYSSDYQVAVLGPKGYTYQAAYLLGMVPKVIEDDTIVVTGKFSGVSSDGIVVLIPIKVKNEGYSE